jgi:hypothetical protein
MSEPTLTAQSIFDTVARHFKQQKVQATDGVTCVYRTLDGKSCAVGCLLNDEEAARVLRGSVFKLYRNGTLPKRLRPFTNESLPCNIHGALEENNLLSALQMIHDSHPDLLNSQSAEQMRDVARHFDLDASEIDWER